MAFAFFNSQSAHNYITLEDGFILFSLYLSGIYILIECITFYAISVILLYYLILHRMSDISENLVHVHLTQLS